MQIKEVSPTKASCLPWRQLPEGSSEKKTPSGIQWSHQEEEIDIRVSAARSWGERRDCAERIQKDLQKSPLEHLADLYILESNSMRLGKEPLKSNKPNHLWSAHKFRKGSYVPTRMKRPQRAWGRLFRRVLP